MHLHGLLPLGLAQVHHFLVEFAAGSKTARVVHMQGHVKILHLD